MRTDFLSALLAHPARENVCLPSPTTANIGLLAYLQLNGLMANTSSREYVDRLQKELGHLNVQAAYNLCNGAELKMPLNIVNKTSETLVFKNRLFPRGSTYTQYCRTRYGIELLYREAPMVEDSNGSIVAIEVVNLSLGTTLATDIPASSIPIRDIWVWEERQVSFYNELDQAKLLKKKRSCAKA